jgi:hypothetical protein
LLLSGGRQAGLLGQGKFLRARTRMQHVGCMSKLAGPRDGQPPSVEVQITVWNIKVHRRGWK